ncbi:putative RNA-directed DNA polymerase [Helianthus annuus]|nr:putative RNA-directed DNA polymerase [Helianthus annuus]
MADNQQPGREESGQDRAEHDIEYEDNNNSEGEVQDQPSTTLRRSSRNIKFPSKLDDFIIEGKVKYGLENVLNYANLSPDNLCFASVLNKSVEPKNYVEAKTDTNWVNAMNEELEALHRNNTWDIVDLPPNRKPIGCKWVYKIKYKSNGEIERFKARLVAKGFSQKEGIDFFDTFSPVVKMVTVRCVLTIVVHNGWDLFQLDINNAFLYGNLNEEVYMTLPDGYDTNSKTKVCKLNKSLYGLKQAPRMWNEKLVDVLTDLGFEQSKCDHSMFIKASNSVFIVLLVYVDDIVITGSCSKEIDKIKSLLKSKFLIKDLGLLKYFLGIEVLKTVDGLCLSQRKYCLDLLSEFGMTGCKPVSNPIEANHVLTHLCEKDNQPLHDISVYQN